MSIGNYFQSARQTAETLQTAIHFATLSIKAPGRAYHHYGSLPLKQLSREGISRALAAQTCDTNRRSLGWATWNHRDNSVR
jgi:hypothetical protein